MDRRAFSLSLASLSLGAKALKADQPGTESRSGKLPIEGARSFSYAGKELRPFVDAKEATLAEQHGSGYMDHMWVGGDFANYTKMRIRIYVDDETKASIDMEMGMGVGVGFADPTAPWGTPFSGITGFPSGIFFNYKIPFSKHLRVTAELPEGTPRDSVFWWILRGIENMPLEVSGIRLPARTRLRLHTVENREVQPLDYFDMCTVNGDGMVFLVTIAAKSKSFAYLETQLRAYTDAASKEPQMLSSGMEDYFMGTYYFNRGMYHLPQSGLTHKDEKDHSFSAYRFHNMDPILLSRGGRLVCRCGEKRGDKLFADPTNNLFPTTYTTYAWVYEW